MRSNRQFNYHVIFQDVMKSDKIERGIVIFDFEINRSKYMLKISMAQIEKRVTLHVLIYK